MRRSRVYTKLKLVYHDARWCPMLASITLTSETTKQHWARQAKTEVCFWLPSSCEASFVCPFQASDCEISRVHRNSYICAFEWSIRRQWIAGDDPIYSAADSFLAAPTGTGLIGFIVRFILDWDKIDCRDALLKACIVLHGSVLFQRRWIILTLSLFQMKYIIIYENI